MKQWTVGGVSELIGAAQEAEGTLGSPCWFRGQESAAWALQPAAFRDGLEADDERQMFLNFALDSPGRYTGPRERRDRLEELSLAQHHGLPTRLLDWTESPLTAAFFAVGWRPGCEPHAKGPTGCAAVWALAADLLLKAQDLASEPFHLMGIHQWVAEIIDRVERNAHGPTPRVLPVHSSRFDPRMVAQLAVHTIHDRPFALNEMPRHEDFLAKFVIPARARRRMSEELERLGFRSDTVFPDLHSLAQRLKVEYRRRAQERLAQ